MDTVDVDVTRRREDRNRWLPAAVRGHRQWAGTSGLCLCQRCGLWMMTGSASHHALLSGVVSERGGELQSSGPHSHHEARSGTDTHDISGVCAPVRLCLSTHEKSPHANLLTVCFRGASRSLRESRLVVCPEDRQEDGIGLPDPRLNHRTKSIRVEPASRPSGRGC